MPNPKLYGKTQSIAHPDQMIFRVIFKPTPALLNHVPALVIDKAEGLEAIILLACSKLRAFDGPFPRRDFEFLEL